MSNNIHDHIIHLIEILSRLTEARLTINYEKCKFGYNKLRILGHVLSANYY